jgi:hypothetical protein
VCSSSRGTRSAAELKRITRTLEQLDYYVQQVREQQKEWKATKKEAAGFAIEIAKGLIGLLF